MANKLFVGNLPYSSTSESLQELFAGIGEVLSASVVTDRDTGRSKGFGFVEMATDELAQAAIKQLDGSELDGRSITVNEARPKVQETD